MLEENYTSQKLFKIATNFTNLKKITVPFCAQNKQIVKHDYNSSCRISDIKAVLSDHNTMQVVKVKYLRIIWIPFRNEPVSRTQKFFALFETNYRKFFLCGF